MKKPKKKVTPIQTAPTAEAGRDHSLDSANPVVKEWAARFDPSDLSVGERAQLAFCQMMFHRHNGFTSPFEEFFLALVLRGMDSYPTPEQVEEELNEYRENFRFTAKIAKAFEENFPFPDEKLSTDEAANAA